MTDSPILDALRSAQDRFESAVLWTQNEELLNRLLMIGRDARLFSGADLGPKAADLLVEAKLPLCILIPELGRDYRELVCMCAPEFTWFLYPVTSTDALEHVPNRELGAGADQVRLLLEDRKRVVEQSMNGQPLWDPGNPKVRPPRGRALQVDWGTPLPKEWLQVAGPAPRWLIRHPDWDGTPCEPGCGDGMIRLGKVGIITSAGGVGKTGVLLDLCIAVCTGRKWLGHFEVDGQLQDPQVLALLAEEDADELRRRLYHWAQQFQLQDHEVDRLSRRLHVLGLAGEDVALAGRPDPRGEIEETDMFRDLLCSVTGRRISLIVVDPLSRFAAGLGVDSDNQAATRIIAGLERIAGETGAAVIVASHSSKASRRENTADVRGATSLVDSARWVAALVDQGDGHVSFQQTKSNYSRPMPKPIVLRRDTRGRLEALSAAEQADYEREQAEMAEAAKQAKVEELANDIVGAMRLGTAANQDEVRSRLKGVGSDRFRPAWRLAVDRGWVVKDDDGRWRIGEVQP